VFDHQVFSRKRQSCAGAFLRLDELKLGEQTMNQEEFETKYLSGPLPMALRSFSVSFSIISAVGENPPEDTPKSQTLKETPQKRKRAPNQFIPLRKKYEERLSDRLEAALD
jgi:hypothetical protein